MSYTTSIVIQYNKSCAVKAKLHYAMQVADLVSDLAFDKFVQICDQLAIFFGRKQVADRCRTNLSVTGRDSSNLSVTGQKPGLRPA